MNGRHRAGRTGKPAKARVRTTMLYWWRRYLSSLLGDRPRRVLMPPKFEKLAWYNAEVSRGVTHTPEHAARMTALQAEYDEWRRRCSETIVVPPKASS